MKNRKNSLQIMWNLITSIFGAVGLVSIVEDFYAWSDFILKLSSYYKTISHGFFEWVPFTINEEAREYFFFGVLTVSSNTKTTFRKTKIGFEEYEELFSILIITPYLIMDTVIKVILWPAIIWHHLKILIIGKIRRKELKNFRRLKKYLRKEKPITNTMVKLEESSPVLLAKKDSLKESNYFFIWLGTIFLFFFLLLVINMIRLR